MATFKSPRDMANQINKTVGEDLQDFYLNEFFKEANGDKQRFIDHHINRFGIPRGSTRKKEIDFYSKKFDELSKAQKSDNDLLLYGEPANEDYLKAQWEVYKQDPSAYEGKVNPDVYSVIRRYGAKVEPDHPIHKRPLLPF